MEEDEAALLRQVFGNSDDDGDDSDYGGISRPQTDTSPLAEGGTDSAPRGNRRWEGVNGIRGLWICRDFLSPARQLSLLSAIHDEGWFLQPSHNQAMRFGRLPRWVNELGDSIREAVLSGDDNNPPDHKSMQSYRDEEESLFPILPLELLGREPLFDQLIANVYHPGQGICAHVDLLRFDDGIAIVSLESPCVMHFTPASSSDIQEVEVEGGHERLKVPVYLSPGSLVVMSGEARYSWKHEINRKPGFQVWDGQELQQDRRISLTLRKLAQVE